MKNQPQKLRQKVDDRKAKNALRALYDQKDLIDFSSNDYLGFASSEDIFRETHHFLEACHIIRNGATGSRLLSGNSSLYTTTEDSLSTFFKTDAALIFNSGYAANMGFFSSVPQRGDVILYDEYVHASIRDGLRMSHAKAYKFAHNDMENLEHLLKRIPREGDIYMVTESVFSMDGDTPDLVRFVHLADRYRAYTIVDEAHAVGVFGPHGCGLIPQLGIENRVFARIVTFGKALGCHGAAILGSELLKTYLINFARSLIYTTALSPHAIATIRIALEHLQKEKACLDRLRNNIAFFTHKIEEKKMVHVFIPSHSAIHCCVIPGNEKAKYSAARLQQHGFDVKPILSPTVPEGQERLRFCIHSYNTQENIENSIALLSTFVP